MLHTAIHCGTELLFMLLLNQKASPPAFGDAAKMYTPMLHTAIHCGTELLFMLLLNQKASPPPSIV
jgi:hypothetical protein